MITLENLKENRDEIIEIITDKKGAQNVKKIMGLMVNMIGYRDYNNINSVKEFTLTVIKDCFFEELIISDSAAYYAEASKRQLGSSMRKY